MIAVPLRLLVGLILLAFALQLQAASIFPKLTGRVVDQAGLLSVSTLHRLERELAAHERQTSNQVVVVTIKSLQGVRIADYGYRLGRYWGIGQKGKDNGVLLIVAPNERRVRIEVGYGLEATLTDALSKNIIETVITPRFKKGEMEEGIVKGTEAILAAIAGTYKPNKIDDGLDTALNFAGFVMILIVMMSEGVRFYIDNRLVASLIAGAIAGFIGYWIFSLTIGMLAAAITFAYQYTVKIKERIGGKYGKQIRIQHTVTGSYSSGGGSSGGFSGGGGSFGGGGASGSW